MKVYVLIATGYKRGAPGGFTVHPKAIAAVHSKAFETRKAAEAHKPQFLKALAADKSDNAMRTQQKPSWLRPLVHIFELTVKEKG